MMYYIHTDGGSRGNPGPSAIGVCVLHNNTVTYEAAKYIGEATNNEAEYTALLSALTWLVEHQEGVTSVVFKLDSKLVVEQVQKRWKIKEPRLMEYAKECWRLLDMIACAYSITYIPRSENSAADALVNKALDEAL